MIYSHSERDLWFKFREECFKQNGRHCERCAKGPQEASLQIHHPHYHSKLKPWEYEPRFCEVLCKGCHAREHGKIKPREGWSLIHSDWDEGSSSGEVLCAECNKSIEWHNDLWHPQWGVITVGYGCAEKLGVPEVHRSKRLNTFLFSPRWQQQSDGSSYRHGKKWVFIKKQTSSYILEINGKLGKLTYETIELAKKGAFDYFEERARRDSAGKN
jgi:hypothetical protein